MASGPLCPSCKEATMTKGQVYGVPRWVCPNEQCNYTMPVIESSGESLKKHIKQNPTKK